MIDTPNSFEQLKQLAEILRSPGDIVAALDSLAGATAVLRTEREQLERDRAAHAGKLADAERAHGERLAAMTAAQTAEHEARLRLIDRKEAGLAAERKAIDADIKQVAARELSIEHAKADMDNRLRLVTAE